MHQVGIKLSERYYQSENVVEIAQDLLGKILVTNIKGQLTSGMIVETEAYKGPEDKASHAYNNRRTKRTEIIVWKWWFGLCLPVLRNSPFV